MINHSELKCDKCEYRYKEIVEQPCKSCLECGWDLYQLHQWERNQDEEEN